MELFNSTYFKSQRWYKKIWIRLQIAFFETISQL